MDRLAHERTGSRDRMIGVRRHNQDRNSHRAVGEIQFDIWVSHAHAFQGVHDHVQVLLDEVPGVGYPVAIVIHDRDGA